MLKNYFKIAIAVLRRRKFFTFISLFGISFTLTILMVATAFIDKVATDAYPDAKRDRSLYISGISEVGYKTNSMRRSPTSFYFLDHYVGSMKTPVKVAISSNSASTNTYVNDKKITIDYKYTNAAFWDVTDFKFTEGKPFDQQQVANAERVTVISEDIKREYFGDEPTVVGKYIEADNVKYRVCGVVKSVPITTYMLYSDIYLPYTVSKGNYKDKGYFGAYLGILLAANKADVPKMQKEFDEIAKRLPVDSKDYDKVIVKAESYMAAYLSNGNEKGLSGLTLATTIIGVFAFLFMLLPTLNLININITRIMERSSEIGVRKAFGASSVTLVYQFIVENLILTVIGAAIAVVLSLIIIHFINSANLVANLNLSLNISVLFYGLITCVLFGLLSGVYPAWRMSKLNVVTALKA
jgi:putative ABC transport system permease protein